MQIAEYIRASAGAIISAQCFRATFGVPEWPGALYGLMFQRVSMMHLGVNTVNVFCSSGGTVGGVFSMKGGTESGASVGAGKNTSASRSAFSLLVVVFPFFGRLRCGMRWVL